MGLVAWYDKEVDILAIKVEEASMADEDLLDNDILIGYDEKGRVVYVEVWDASKRDMMEML